MNDDSEEIGPDDGTIEMDRDAILKRVKKRKKPDPFDATTERMQTVGGEDSEETQSIAVPAELLRAMNQDTSSMGPQTIDIPLEAIDESDTHTSTQTTQPIGPISFLELVAMIDENGCIQLPATLVKTPGFGPGSSVKIRIESMED